MKKVLALVLAVMMMATVAFAANPDTGGSTGVIDNTIGTDGVLGGINGVGVNPDGKVIIKAGAFENSNGENLGSLLRKGDFSSENFTVTTKRFEKGANLVKSVEFDDDENYIAVKLNDNYDLKRTDTINLVIKEIKISAKRKVNEDVTKNSKWTCNKETIDPAVDTLDYRVGYAIVRVEISDDFDVHVDKDSGVVEDVSASDDSRSVIYSPNGNLVKFVKGTASYGTANIEFGDVAYASGRVYKDDTVFLKFNEDVNVDLVKKYPDADLSFVNFKGAPTFNSNMELEIYADEDQYIYEVKDNKIAACSLKWDDEAYAFTGKVRTLGAYVISDTKLSIDTTAADGNPDTGANDVVGIATALAAVALVSAAAVSLLSCVCGFFHKSPPAVSLHHGGGFFLPCSAPLLMSRYLWYNKIVRKKPRY